MERYCGNCGDWTEFDEDDFLEDSRPFMKEVYARYMRGEIVEALYELEKIFPNLKDIHKKVVER